MISDAAAVARIVVAGQKEEWEAAGLAAEKTSWLKAQGMSQWSSLAVTVQGNGAAYRFRRGEKRG